MVVRFRFHSFLIVAAIAAVAGVGCHEPEPPKTAQQGSIKDVVVVLKGSDEPLPFDPRGGRITVVTQEIARLVGHPIILELDAALSPELKASLEETVLASFETLARELVLLQKEDVFMFAQAQKLERVICKYDAVIKESQGKIVEGGKVLAVSSPPDRFPLLERGVVSEAVYFAYIGDLEARWGDADPTRLPAREQGPYFAYMMTTRPGAGYLWIAARAKKTGSSGASSWDDLRAEHVERILRLAGVVEHGSPLEKKVRRFLLEQAVYVGEGNKHASSNARSGLTKAYGAWLEKSAATFDDDEKAILARALFEQNGHCSTGRMSEARDDCPPAFPFDRLAFGLSIYDAWVKDGARVGSDLDHPQGPRGELFKKVVCPTKRRGESETEIRYGCSPFFAQTLAFDRARLADAIAKRRDPRLLELALLNLGTKGGTHALALVESLRDEALFHQGMAILFHDFARRDDVKSALEEAAPRFWRDTPSRRGFALLVMARKSEGLDIHYGDNQWSRFPAEFGGPIQRELLASYLMEGPRAIEMAPKIWPALAKNADRDELIAKSLPLLLARDREARTSRAKRMLVLLRIRLCEEKDATGLATVRASIDRWVKDHPDDAAAMSNALADFTMARCKQPPKETD